jgi:hypothetical protein
MAAPLKSDDENTASADSASAASELNGLDAKMLKRFDLA